MKIQKRYSDFVIEIETRELDEIRDNDKELYDSIKKTIMELNEAAHYWLIYEQG